MHRGIELNVGQSDRKRGGLADNVDVGDGRRSAHGVTTSSVAVRASVLRANIPILPLRLFRLDWARAWYGDFRTLCNVVSHGFSFLPKKQP